MWEQQLLTNHTAMLSLRQSRVPLLNWVKLLTLNLACPASGYGGAKQYLQAMLPTSHAASTFLFWLQDQVALNPGVSYLMEGPVDCCMKGQEDSVASFCLPIWKFSYADSSSLREPPLLDTSYRLWQRFEKEGFLTSGEALIVFFQAGHACSEVCFFSGPFVLQPRPGKLLQFME